LVSQWEVVRLFVDATGVSGRRRRGIEHKSIKKRGEKR